MPTQTSMLDTRGMFSANMPGKEELFVRLTEYKKCKENLERKVSGEHVLLKAMTRSAKQLESRVSFL